MGMKEYIVQAKAQETIDSFDAHNAPELIRCKDCKYAHITYDGECKYCDMLTDDDGNPIERYLPGDWFCADGEMRDDDA